MKTPKCPLCGTPLKLSTIESKGKLHFYACYECNYQLRMSPSQDFALEYAKTFISKFPPIVRVQAGDKLTYFGTSDIVTVVSKDMDTCEIKIEYPTGDRYILEPKDVAKWPWELDQEGGQQ